MSYRKKTRKRKLNETTAPANDGGDKRIKTDVSSSVSSSSSSTSSTSLLTSSSSSSASSASSSSASSSSLSSLSSSASSSSSSSSSSSTPSSGKASGNEQTDIKTNYWVRLKYDAPKVGGGTFQLCCSGEEGAMCMSCKRRSVRDQRKKMSPDALEIHTQTRLPLDLCKMADSYTSSIAVLWFAPWYNKVPIIPLAVYLSRAAAEASLRKHAGLSPDASIEPFIPVYCSLVQADLLDPYNPTGYDYHQGGRPILLANGTMHGKITDLCQECGRRLDLHAATQAEHEKVQYSLYEGSRPHVFYQFPQLTEAKIHHAFKAARDNDPGGESDAGRHPAHLVLVMHDGNDAHGCPMSEEWRSR